MFGATKKKYLQYQTLTPHCRGVFGVKLNLIDR